MHLLRPVQRRSYSLSVVEVTGSMRVSTSATSMVDALLQLKSTSLDEATMVRWGEKVGGLVITGPDALSATTRVREAGGQFTIILDLQPAVIPKDHQLPPPDAARGAAADAVVSPSRVLAAHDHDAVARQLRRGSRWLTRTGRRSDADRIGLMLDSQWLTAAGSEALAADLLDSDRPVALSFVDRNDPLGSRDSIFALRRILSIDLSIALFRTDLAGIGGLVHGADLAALGFTSSLRHVHPAGSQFGGSRNRSDTSPNVLHPLALSWVRASRLWRARGETDLRSCGLPLCGGLDLGRFRYSTPGDPEPHLHSVEVWLTVLDRLWATATWERSTEWAVICVEAHRARERFENETGVALRSSPLAAWTSLTPSP